jgi:hypothetical protein
MASRLHTTETTSVVDPSATHELNKWHSSILQAYSATSTQLLQLLMQHTSGQTVILVPSTANWSVILQYQHLNTDHYNLHSLSYLRS